MAGNGQHGNFGVVFTWPIMAYTDVNGLKNPSVKLGKKVFGFLTSLTP